MKSHPKIALVYDRVNTPHGGAEKLLLALQQIYTNAPLYTSVYDAKKAQWAKNFNIKTSFLQKIPFAKNLHRHLAWAMPLAFESLDLSDYDLIISITSAEAKGIITRADQLHICYLLTPTRYLYSHKQDYLNSLPKIDLLRNLANKLLNNLKSWDQVAIHRPDIIIPISELVKQRTKKYYGIETEKVIYPAIISPNKTPLSKNLERESGSAIADQMGEASESQAYYLVISRLVAYKRIDLCIKACQKLDKNLIIIGEGPELNRLKKLAKVDPSASLGMTSFVASPSDEEVKNILQNCQALLMPGLEDFGITALEATAQNIPVIIHEKSGVAEILKNNPRVFKIKSESKLEITNAIKKLESRDKAETSNYKAKTNYDTRYFLDKFSSTIERYYVNFQSKSKPLS